MDNVHHIDNMTFLTFTHLDGMRNGEYPLWTPYFFGGYPILAIPENYLINLDILLLFLTRSVFFTLKTSILLYFFLAGVGMYFLTWRLTKNYYASILAALIFQFNGLVHSFVLHGHPNILQSYALIPFAFLFTYLAFTSRHWIAYSILGGLFLALQILGGGIIFFLYTGVLIGFLFLWQLTRKGIVQRAIKACLVGVVLMFTLLGLSAAKLLYSLEFTAMSSRAVGVGYQQYLGNPIVFSDFFGLFVTSIGFDKVSGALGVVGFLLFLASFALWKKRIVLVLGGLVLFALLLSSGTFIAQLMFDHAPGFDKLRNIERALVLFVFAGSLLGGLGLTVLHSYLQKQQWRQYASWILIGVIGVVVVELVFLHQFPQSTDIVRPTDIGVLQHMTQDQGDFRVINLALREFIGTTGYVYYAQEGIGDIKGGGGIWTNDYIGYLSVAQQYSPARIWGLMSGKYVVSGQNQSIEGLRFVGEFNYCQKCAVNAAFGPYLYENEHAVARAYVTENTILVTGPADTVTQQIWLLLLADATPHGKAYVSAYKPLDQYGIDELMKYKAVILTQAPSASGQALLSNYVQRGGQILPDIFAGQGQLDETTIQTFLLDLGQSYDPIDFSWNYNTARASVQGKQGFLVLAERYAHFPGWEAHGSDGPLLRVDNYLSGVFIDGNDVEFVYRPASFRKGLLISLFTFVVLLSYFGFFFYRKLKKKHTH